MRPQRFLFLSSAAVAAVIAVVPAAMSSASTTDTNSSCLAPPSTSTAPTSDETIPPIDTTPPTSVAPEIGDDDDVEAVPTTEVVDVEVEDEQASPTTEVVDVVDVGIDDEQAVPTTDVLDVSVVDEAAASTVEDVLRSGSSSALGLRTTRGFAVDAPPPAPPAPAPPPIAPAPRPVKVVRVRVLLSTDRRGVVFYELFGEDDKPDKCNPYKVSFHRSDLPGTNREIRLNGLRNMQCRLVSLTVGGKADPSARIVTTTRTTLSGEKITENSVHYTATLGGIFESKLVELEVHCSDLPK